MYTVTSIIMIILHYLSPDIFSVNPSMAYLLQYTKSHALASLPPRQPKQKQQFGK